MEPILTVMVGILIIIVGVSCVISIYDYIRFNNKYCETQLEINYLKKQILSLNIRICNMTIEIRENNKIIKNFENKIQSESLDN